MKYASLMVLSFNRKGFLQRSLESLWAHTDYPYQLIVLDDGSDTETQDYVYSLVKAQRVSTALFNCGGNLGIGVAVNRGLRIARGDPVLKLDADLIYCPGWLTEVVRLLEDHREIGCLGLFKYHHPPRVFERDVLRDNGDYYEVVDFVGSAIAARREVWERFAPWAEGAEHCFGEDKVFKMTVQQAGYALALPKADLCENIGFGEDKTSLIKVIDWKEGKHVYHLPHSLPLIFGVPNA